MYTTLIREGVLYEELSLEEAVQKLRGYAWNMEDQILSCIKLENRAIREVMVELVLPYIQRMKLLQVIMLL
ncbi:hypothetical protein HanXRQr2_Chr17g0809941 [Helianthus annuus]|uniref:Uncharacterized protein n=1 Tax=Helianthus annuus TaxID=4232 RepID=A0A9K3GV20_HELAN|nr:hypothetical protein HanXRQr2_Chr17g0809941 [Helianthus annuus]